MIKLFNLSNHSIDLERFAGGYKEISGFMVQHRLDGIEFIKSGEWDPEVLPASLIQGMHLRFWPIWLDFWRGDTEKLIRQFGDLETVEGFYGGLSRNALVEYYRKEIELAKGIGVRYAVFHVSHVEPEHCFSYRFTYSSEEVADAAIELLNEVFQGFEGDFELLLENLWWPGLTLVDIPLAHKLLEEVQYPHKGFMLDISHMMNTNTELNTEEEAVEYILERFEALGSLKDAVKGIHLNSSLSGEYVKSQYGNRILEGEKDFYKRYIDSYMHVLKIDRHVPFEDISIRKVIDAVRPEYLVYEFLSEKLEQLTEFVEKQNEVLGL